MDQVTADAICPICSSDNTVLIRPYNGLSALFSDRMVMGCRNCTMAFVFPLPPDQELAKYNAGYFSNAHGGISTDKLTVAFHSAINLLRVLYAEDFIQKQGTQIGHVLEVGPGGGHFARHWLRRNTATQSYTGIESDASCHRHLIDLGVSVSTSVEKIDAERRYDLVVISHVLEHTSDPYAFIRSFSKHLSEGGVLFIEVPCRDFEHKKIDEPHLLFFDKGPMRILLERSGFANLQLSYHGNTLTRLKKKRSRFGQKLHNAFLKTGLYFLQGSEKGLERIDNTLERAVIKPFQAHIEQQEASWWLRAIATKNKDV